MNGSSTATVALIRAPATTHIAAPASRRRDGVPTTMRLTAAIIASIMIRSLCAPPSAYSTYSGLAPTTRIASTGSRPRARAQRQVNASVPALASSASSFMPHSAPTTPSGASG